ncbi:MAG: hypothetical protein R3F30_11755 [Planctomycetota bacterium]
MLRPGDRFRASVSKVCAGGDVVLGFRGLELRVASRVRLERGDELELLVVQDGDGLRLRILRPDEADGTRPAGRRAPRGPGGFDRLA